MLIYNTESDSICSTGKAVLCCICSMQILQILYLIGTAALRNGITQLIQLSLAPLAKLKPAQISTLLPAAQRQDTLLMFLLPRAAFHYINPTDCLIQLAFLALHHLNFLIKAYVKHFYSRV